MSYKIITTPESELTFQQNLDYLEKEWYDKVINQFIEQVDKAMKKIKRDPFIFPLYEYGYNVRRAIINKHIILFYRIVDDNTIELLTFWNTSRNPEDLKL